ncbi:hypothetical protein ACJX0J_014180, partial [Zea mays]
GHTAVIYRHMHPPPRLLLRCLPLTPRLLHATSSMQHSSPPMWPPSHQRHDASCEEDDLYGYGGIVNEWGTIGLLLLEAAAERIVGDGALETWGVTDKATRVKLCMLAEDLFVCPCGGPARGRSHASRRAARNVFEERQLHSHLHRVVVAALSIQVPHLPRHHESLGGFAASLKKKNVWVMNVVPFTESGKLKIIYDRGLMGTTHD